MNLQNIKQFLLWLLFNILLIIFLSIGLFLIGIGSARSCYGECIFIDAEAKTALFSSAVAVFIINLYYLYSVVREKEAKQVLE